MKGFKVPQPAVIHTLLAAVLALLAVWGLDATEVGDKLGQSVDLIFVIAAGLGGLYIRKSVTPNSRVVEQLDHGEVVAGAANDINEAGQFVREHDLPAVVPDEFPDPTEQV